LGRSPPPANVTRLSPIPFPLCAKLTGAPQPRRGSLGGNTFRTTFNISGGLLSSCKKQIWDFLINNALRSLALFSPKIDVQKCDIAKHKTNACF
jgi:hypothetical protein